MSAEEQQARYASDVECAIGLNITPGAAGVYAARDAVLAVRDREMAQLRADLTAEGEEVIRLMNHNDENCEVVAERDRLETELERLRTGIRELAATLAAETHSNSAADLITKGHAANRVLDLIGERP